MYVMTLYALFCSGQPKRTSIYVFLPFGYLRFVAVLIGPSKIVVLS
jgi:hypothetical protein